MTKRNRIARRAICALTCACMLLCAVAAAGETMHALPTPTPVPPAPEETLVPNEEEHAAAPRSAEGAGNEGDPTEEPPGETAAPAQTDTVPPDPETPDPNAGGEGVPTGDEPTAEPTAQQTEGAGETTPTAPAAAETPSAAPGQNPSAEPTCADPDCPHVKLDKEGNPVAACAVGAWLLSQPEEGDGLISLMSASEPTPIALRNGENTIYRSGTYSLTGGGKRAKLGVAKGLAVSLTMKDVTLLTLTLSKKAAVSLGFTKQNAISTIAARSATLRIDGEGSLTVVNCNCGKLTVLGGSVDLPTDAVSDNGRAEYAFDATGATSATVDGEAFPFVEPNASNQIASLWLPKLVGGAYAAKVENGVLTILSVPDAPDTPNEFSFSSAQPFADTPDTDYRLVMGSAPNESVRALAVTCAGVTLALNGIGEESYKPVIDATNQQTTLYLSGANRLEALNASAGGAVKLAGTGSLRLDGLGVGKLTASGALTVSVASLPDPFAAPGWQPVQTSATLVPDVSATFEGRAVPLLYTPTDPQRAYAPLPAPNGQYVGELDGGKLTISAIPSGARKLTLAADDLTYGGTGSVVVGSEQGATGGFTADDGSSMTVTLSDAVTSGALRIGKNATVTLKLAGASRFASLSVGEGATVNVVGEGSLLLGGATGESGATVTVDKNTNLSLSSGTLPGCAQTPTVIHVTDDANRPMAGAAISLRIGSGEAFATATCTDGTVTLWRDAALSGVSVVVLRGAETYAAILGSGNLPVALPVVSDVRVPESDKITFTTDVSCRTKGLIYYISSAARGLDARYDAKAKIVYADANGVGDMPALQLGQTISCRAFAALASGKLGADTEDAFGFSGVFSVGAPRPIAEKDRQKTYDGKKFEFKEGVLPDGASVSFYDKDGKSCSPTNVGTYTAQITVPAGGRYMPGVYSVEVKINRITIMFYPSEASKKEGEADPEFYFDESNYDKEKMLEGDSITGTLTRAKGEKYGNYAYLNTKLEAKEYYYIKIDDYTKAFFIDWGPHHYLPYDPFKKIDPVYDEVRLSTGKSVVVQTTTTDLLKIGDMYFGNPITDTLDGKARPFTPSLRLLGGFDSALLILTTEPELNEDGGYLTDLDGNVVKRGRRLTLSNWALNKLGEHHIDYIALALDGVSMLVRLDDLRSGGAVDEVLAEAGIRRAGSYFMVTLEPVGDEDDLIEGEEAAGDAARLREPLSRVTATVRNGDELADIAPALIGSTVSFDASALLPAQTVAKQEDVVETVDGQPVVTLTDETAVRDNAAIAAANGTGEATGELLEIARELLDQQLTQKGYSLYFFDTEARALGFSAIVPYTASEERTASFTALMRTKPYLTTVFTQNGLYGLYTTAKQ